MTIDETPGKGTTPSSAHEIERYGGLFARRTRGMTSSAMRDMMAVTARPEVISLATGLPDTTTFPAEDFAMLMSRVAVDSSAAALQYGPTDGLDSVRRCIVQVMAAEGTEVEVDDLMVTTGGQQVIDLVCRAFLDPGDVVVAEAPTYPGAVPCFNSYQADVVQIEMDDDGMRIDVLEATLARLREEGRRPKFIYTIPNFQNPGGVTMPLDRRKELVRIANEQELVILEDNPYGLLRYEGEPLPTLYSLDGGRYVTYAGTFSKILSAGLRIGWAAAPAPILERLNLGKQAADLCSSPLNQYFVVEYFKQRDWRKYLEELRGIYRRRRDIRLPDYIDTTDLLARALREHVAFVPGRAAYLDGRGGSEMRLNFSGVGDDDIREGIRRIGKVIAEQVALYGTLTGTKPAKRPADVVEFRRREAS